MTTEYCHACESEIDRRLVADCHPHDTPGCIFNETGKRFKQACRDEGIQSDSYCEAAALRAFARYGRPITARHIEAEN
jgi:hypothetical protein